MLASSSADAATHEARLATLRASVGIARALGRALVLPQWLSSHGDALMDVKALADVVPVVPAADAIAAATKCGGGVTAVMINSGDGSPRACSPTATVECLGADAQAVAAAEHIILNIPSPLRSKAEVQGAFSACEDSSVLLLPRLEGTLLSASATVMGMQLRTTLSRALATPAPAVQP